MENDKENPSRFVQKPPCPRQRPPAPIAPLYFRDRVMKMVRCHFAICRFFLVGWIANRPGTPLIADSPAGVALARFFHRRIFLKSTAYREFFGVIAKEHRSHSARSAPNPAPGLRQFPRPAPCTWPPPPPAANLRTAFRSPCKTFRPPRGHVEKRPRCSRFHLAWPTQLPPPA
jgi:hypothetical protein